MKGSRAFRRLQPSLALLRKRAQERDRAHLTDLYATLSQANQAMLRATSETELFQDICRICVEFGHFGLVQIAVLENGQISTMAAAGPMQGYLDGLEDSTNPDDPLGQGPTGRAFRGERHVVCQDWDRDPSLRPWRNRGASNGIHASGSFPVCTQAGVKAVLNLYSGRQNSFLPDKVALLDGLTDNMAFALDKFQEERLRREAEAALRRKKQLYEDLVEHQLAGIYRLISVPDKASSQAEVAPTFSGPARLDFVSDRFCQILGITREAFAADLNLHVSLLHPEDRMGFIDQRALAVRHQRAFHWQGRLGTGPQQRWLQFESYPRPLGLGEVLWTGLLTDITESRHVEESLREERNQYQDLVTTLPLGIYRLRVRPVPAVTSSDWEGTYLSQYRIEFVSDRFCAILGVSREAFQADASLVMGRIHPDHRADFSVRNAKALVGMIPFFWEGPLVEETPPRWIRFESTPRHLPDGGSLWTGVLTDITERRKANADFRRLHGLLRQAEVIAKVGGWEIDLEENTLYWTEETYRIHELDPGAYVPGVASAIQFYTPEGRPVIAQAVQRVIDLGESFDLELELVTAAGRCLWVRVSGEGILRDGRVVKVLGILRDITEERSAEEALRTSEARARTMLQTTLEGVWLLRQDGTFEDMNQAACRMVGHTREDLLGFGVWDLEAQENQEQIRDHIKRVTERGQDVFETILRRRDGTLFPADVSVMAIALTGEQVAFVRDITDRKRNEAIRVEALANARRFSQALDQSSSYIYIKDSQHRYVYANHSTLDLFGCTAEEVVGTDDVHHFPPSTAARIYDIDTRVLESGLPTTDEVEAVTLDGKRRIFLARKSPIYDPDQPDQIWGLCGISTDITDLKRTEAALRESEVRYRTLFDNNHAIKLLVDPSDGQIVEANPAAAHFYGWTQEQLQGMYLHQINVMPAGQIQRILAEVVDSRKDHYEFIHRRADGSLRNMDIYTGPIEVGGRTLLYSILHDATDRVRAVEANAHLLHILESSLNEIYIFSVDSLRYEYANRAALENLGYAHEIMLAMTPLDLKIQFTESSFREVLAPLLNHEQRQISFDAFHQRGDGSQYPVEVHVQLAGHPDQQVFLAVALDISERRAAEEALGARLNQLEIMHELAKLPDGHSGKDLLREGLERIVRIQGGQMGFLRLLLEDQEPLDLTVWPAETMGHRTTSSDAHYPMAMSGISDAEKLRRPVIHNEYPGPTDLESMPRGQVLLTRELVVPIVEAGQVRMIVGIGNKPTAYDEADVDQLEVVAGDLWKGYARQCMGAEIQELNRTLEHRVEQRTYQLEAANQELEAFAYSVSHDLRAPLRTIAGFTEALSRDSGSVLSTEGQGYLKRVLAGTTRMAQLIEDLLLLSRIGRDDCIKVPLDLGALAEQVLTRFREAEPDHPMVWEVTRPILANGNSRLLRVLLENLLGNAWKFTSHSPDPRVWVTARPVNGTSLEVTVRDNGVGFSASQVGRLFTPFQRLHKAEDFPGTGIGLAIAKRIVSRHGGWIRAEGDVGHGAAFTFTLPGSPGGAP